MEAKHKVVNGMCSNSFADENWNNVFQKVLHVQNMAFTSFVFFLREWVERFFFLVPCCISVHLVFWVNGLAKFKCVALDAELIMDDVLYQNPFS